MGRKATAMGYAMRHKILFVFLQKRLTFHILSIDACFLFASRTVEGSFLITTSSTYHCASLYMPQIGQNIHSELSCYFLNFKSFFFRDVLNDLYKTFITFARRIRKSPIIIKRSTDIGTTNITLPIEIAISGVGILSIVLLYWLLISIP